MIRQFLLLCFIGYILALSDQQSETAATDGMLLYVGASSTLLAYNVNDLSCAYTFDLTPYVSDDVDYVLISNTNTDLYIVTNTQVALFRLSSRQVTRVINIANYFYYNTPFLDSQYLYIIIGSGGNSVLNRYSLSDLSSVGSIALPQVDFSYSFAGITSTNYAVFVVGQGKVLSINLDTFTVGSVETGLHFNGVSGILIGDNLFVSQSNISYTSGTSYSSIVVNRLNALNNFIQTGETSTLLSATVNGPTNEAYFIDLFAVDPNSQYFVALPYASNEGGNTDARTLAIIDSASMEVVANSYSLPNSAYSTTPVDSMAPFAIYLNGALLYSGTVDSNGNSIFRVYNQALTNAASLSPSSCLSSTTAAPIVTISSMQPTSSNMPTQQELLTNMPQNQAGQNDARLASGANTNMLIYATLMFIALLYILVVV